MLTCVVMPCLDEVHVIEGAIASLGFKPPRRRDVKAGRELGAKRADLATVLNRHSRKRDSERYSKGRSGYLSSRSGLTAAPHR